MKTKKCGVYAALAAALLITAALVTGCPESLILGDLTAPQMKEIAAFQPPPGKQPAASQPAVGEQPAVSESGQPAAIQPPAEGGQPAASKAYLRVNFGSSSNGRTIMPSFEADHYVLTATHTVTGTGTENPIPSITVSGTESSGQLQLTAGQSYTVEVIAYADDEEDVQIASGSTPSAITVESDGSSTASITLTLETSTATSTGSGTFKWNITLPTTPNPLSTATITLSSTPGGSGITGANATTIMGAASNNTTTGVTVPAGVYYVTVEVTAAAHASYRKMDVVHIFGGLPTTYTDVLPTALAENTYTVTYANYNGLGNTATFSDPVKQQHGNAIRNYFTVGDGLGGKPILDSGVTGMDGYVLERWYKENTLDNPWIFSGTNSDKIYRPITLYGKWIEPLGIAVTITDPVVTGTTFTLGASSSTISQTTLLNSNPNVVITITESTATGWTNFRWYMNGNTTTPLAGGSGTGITLVFDDTGNAGTPPPVGHTVTITLIAATNPGGTDYSGTLTLTIDN